MLLPGLRVRYARSFQVFYHASAREDEADHGDQETEELAKEDGVCHARDSVQIVLQCRLSMVS